MKKIYLTYASRALTLGLCLFFCAGEVQAQKGDIAGAEALFQEGRRLMDEGKSEAACPKFEESQRLDPGTGTLWHLARCYQETGRLATAWATFHQVAQEAQRLGEKPKVKAALDRAKKLEPKLHKLRIEVPEENQVKGLAITRGDAQVGSGAWGAAVPVDKGEVLIEASAPGHETWTETVDVSGKKREHSITIPLLEVSPTPEVEPIVEPKKKKRKKRSGERWYHDKVGWAVFATGIATAAGGGGTFLYAGKIEDDGNASMDLGDRDRLFDQAHSYEVTGGVLLATGAGIALTGMVLLALTPDNGDTEEVAFDFSPSLTIDTHSATFGLSKDF